MYSSLDEAYGTSITPDYEMGTTTQRELGTDYQDIHKFNTGFFNKDNKLQERKQYYKEYNKEKKTLADRYLQEFNYILKKEASLTNKNQSSTPPTNTFKNLNQTAVLDYTPTHQGPLKSIHQINNDANGNFYDISGKNSSIDQGMYAEYQNYDIYNVAPNYYNKRGKNANNNIIRSIDNGFGSGPNSLQEGFGSFNQENSHTPQIVNCKSVNKHIRNCQYCTSKLAKGVFNTNSNPYTNTNKEYFSGGGGSGNQDEILVYLSVLAIGLVFMLWLFSSS